MIIFVTGFVKTVSKGTRTESILFPHVKVTFMLFPLKFGGLPVYLFDFNITRIAVVFTKYLYIAKVL